MNIFEILSKLDSLYAVNEGLSREDCIDTIKAAGFNYKFDKYSDQQLFRIAQRVSVAKDKTYTDFAVEPEREARPTCDYCGRALTEIGDCPVCDLGDESLVFENKSRAIKEWNVVTPTSAPKTAASAAPIASFAKPIVTIVYDKNKLRARADDGIHGPAFVAFPNTLRNAVGQQYEVDELTWNGKNYRVSGEIKLVNSALSTLSINENKETFKMNLESIFEELDRIYEENSEQLNEGKLDQVEGEEADEEIDIEIENDEEATPVEDSPEVTQTVIECAKCGGVTVVAKADVAYDEDTDLVNVGKACQYCEAEDGFKVLDDLIPVAVEETEEEPVEESIINMGNDEMSDGDDSITELFDINAPAKINVPGLGGTGNDVDVL